MNSYAFLSYSRADSAFALKLATEMKGVGFRIWIDQIDISPGERWDRAVESALAGASSLLVVLSPSSVESNNVNDEVAVSIDEGKLVVPLLHLDCKVPMRLRRLQYVDFRSDFEQGKATLAQRLTALQAGEVSPPLAKAADPLPGYSAIGVPTAQKRSRVALPFILLAVFALVVGSYVLWAARDASKPEQAAPPPISATTSSVFDAGSIASIKGRAPVLVEGPASVPASQGSAAVFPSALASNPTIAGSPVAGEAKVPSPKSPAPRAKVSEPAVTLRGLYKGTAYNLTAGKSAAIELKLEERGGRISGTLLVLPPLGGSGPVAGIRKGPVVDFQGQPTNGGIDLLFHGTIDGSKLSGTYKVRVLPELRARQPNLQDQNGRWEVTR